MKSLSLFVGTGKCNGRCEHCAGLPLRKYAPEKDGEVADELIKIVKECYDKGARYLSISSSGEPTLSPLSVTKVLRLVNSFEFSPINLYSNGIRIGEDLEFCKKYLKLWKSLGLTTVYITVHDIDEVKNAKIYGIDKYPSLKLIFDRIHSYNLLVRVNLVLSKKSIGNFDKFVETVTYLRKIGVDFISAWPIRDLDDKVDLELNVGSKELDKMDEWIKRNGFIKLLREESKEKYEIGEKLTLFPNGVLSNKWCN